MQFWTNGLLKSTVHRVTFPEGENQDRYSIAFFCHPLNHVDIEPIPSQIVRDKSLSLHKHGERFTAEGYLKKRLKETYDWEKIREKVASD